MRTSGSCATGTLLNTHKHGTVTVQTERLRSSHRSTQLAPTFRHSAVEYEEAGALITKEEGSEMNSL